jgi:tetraacyldisaccharide 4'-kinase
MQLTKPQFWNNKKPNFISYLLKPFTLPILINNLIIDNSNKLKFQRIKSICVGNIYIGGTGKTPTTLKLYKIIKKFSSSVVTAKKFHKSHLDEINLLKNSSNFITASNRKKIFEKAINQKYKYLIFDDGLQDKNVDYNIKIVCFNAKQWTGNGELIPSGPLREKIKNLKKYDIVFINNQTKKNDNFTKIVKKNNPKIHIFNTYYNIVNIHKFNLKKKYFVFSGIGNPENFDDLLKSYKFRILKHSVFPDHYSYNKNEYLKIIKIAKTLKCKILTTEKDYIKIPKVLKKKIDFIKIDLMIQNEKKLIKILKSKINE